MDDDLTRQLKMHWRLLSVVLAALLAGGCASLDPTADIDAASSHVEDRAGTQPAWSQPWDEWSQAWDGRSPLSNEAAVRAALQNNRAIRRRVEQIVAARADYVQAHLLPNPVVNVVFGLPTDGLGGDPLMVSAVQQLAALWRRPDQIDEADRRLQAEVLSVSDDALRLVADVRTAHAEVVYAELALELQHDNVELLDRTLELLRQRQDVGEASQLDVNRVALDREAARIAMIDRQASLDRAKRSLLQLIGRAEAGVDWTTDSRPAVDEAIDVPSVEAVWIERACMQRLDVAAALARVDAQAAQVQLESLGRLPDVSAGVGYNREFSDREGVFPSVMVEVPVLDDNSAQVARSVSMYRQAVLEADRVRQLAIAEARAAWIAARAQLKAAASYESSIVELAQTNHDLAQQAFEAGETDLTVLLDAQRQLNAARVEQADRRLAAAREVLELERAVGGTLRDIASQPDAAEKQP